jgi:dipeptidyl aminopeptidase/acylaminoacyl peptidase
MKPTFTILSYLVVAALFMGIGYFAANRNQPITETNQEIKEQFVRTLDKYTIDEMSKRQIPKSPITLTRELEKNDDFTSYLFEFHFDPTLEGKTSKKLTGVVNIPASEDENAQFPLIFMNRGYADQSIYRPGIGTQPSAKEYAKNGFMTIAPDFLGYGESDSNHADVLESRFQSYTTALSLWKNLDSLTQWDKKHAFLWGHSNGGLITLTLLEITKEPIPTVLWAPVSKPFPYAVLAYTDESADRGKFLRQTIANFEKNYNPDLYSFDLYVDRIWAPIQIHQGGADDAVPVWWSTSLVNQLKKAEIEVEYFTYPGADHNMRPAWDIVVTRSIEFYKKHLAILTKPEKLLIFN